MKILWMLSICIFSSTANAQTWDAISAAWKAEVETVTSRCTGEYKIEVLTSGEKTGNKVECEIARSGPSFYSVQKRDGTFVSVTANNPSYSFQLGRVKGQDEWSITAVKPGLESESDVLQVLCREGYGAGANLMCLPVVWRELLFMTESSNFSTLEVQPISGDFLEINFVVNKELYTSGRFPFEGGKLTLLKEYPYWPSRMELNRKGDVITEEMVQMMIKSGIKGSDGKPVSMSLAGQKMDDGKLIAVWTYASKSGDMVPKKLAVSGNAYSQYSVVRTDKGVVYDDDKTYLTHWGFAEPTGMPSRNGLGLWGWLTVGVIGFVVVVFSFLKFKR